jgi:predicted nuclease with RNAse H fold
MTEGATEKKRRAGGATLGVDLASQAKKTVAAVIRWGADRATVELHPRADDATILTLARAAEVSGVDAPFGWPRPFVDFLAEDGVARARRRWDNAYRDALTYRRTDAFVRSVTGSLPLSVSADRIAYVAMRCGLLLAQLGVTDRSGDGRVFEVYPGAALGQWGLRKGDEGSYKQGAKGEGARRTILERLVQACPWLELSAEQRSACVASDDVLDALLAALNARAAQLGRTLAPATDEDRELARVEGWIALPRAGTLAGLLCAEVRS